MHLPPSFRSMRRPQRSTYAAVRCRFTVIVWLVVGVVLSGSTGCATFGRRGPTAEKIAACRELSRQGSSAIETGQWQRAEMLLQQALEASPEDSEAHRAIAEVLWQRGAGAQAITHLAAALAVRANDPRLAVRAGEISLALGDRDAALDYAEQAIRLDPQLAAAWALRGRVFWQLQQPDRALADLQRALEFAPDRSDVLLDLAVIYRDRGQPTRCLTTLYHLHDTYPPGEAPQAALVLEGITLLDLNRPYQACDALHAATLRASPTAQMLYYLAHAQYQAGRYREATSAAQQALAMDASHEASRQLLAQLAAHTPLAEPQRR